MAPDRSDKPLYQLGLYECLSSEETKCLKCSTDEKPKIIKTAKCSYSALVTHLKYHEVEQAKYHQLLQAGNTGQQPISAYVVNHIGSLTVLDRKILHLIAEATLPFNVVNHPTFRVLFGSTKHNESLKEEKHYRNVVLPKVYSYACQSIRALLGECEWLSFTCDIGSGPNDSFFALTAHGITRKWERKRYLLNVREFPGHHYGPLVKTMVDDLLKEWGIDEARVNCVVHDEGSNMEAAFAHTDMQDANCGAHQINLIVRSLWPNPKKNETASVVSILLTKCRNIVSEFRYSHIAAQQLVGYQKHHKLPEHHLVQDVTTRWDSTFLMLNRLLEQRAAIDGYYVNKKPDSMLSVADWALIQELHDLLKPFTMFNKALCRDTSPISMQVAMAK
ncbi:zinc finger protein, partial [Aphelenchoides avenae]